MSRSLKEQPSYFLSRLLRHTAPTTKLLNGKSMTVLSDGFVPVNEILSMNVCVKEGVELQDLVRAVQACQKQRFMLVERTHDGHRQWMIRANQGHSFAVDAEIAMTRITLEMENDLKVVVHGTYKEALVQIRQSGGLSRMKRQHVHFSTFDYGEKNVISGMRRNVNVLMYLDWKRAITEGGLELYLSANRVVLCAGNEHGIIPIQYFDRIVELYN